MNNIKVILAKAKNLFLEHKAIGVGLMLVLSLIIADGVIFFSNLTNRMSQGEQQEITQEEENKKQEQPQPTPSPEQQPTNKTTSTSSGCNTVARDTIIANYNAAVAAENARHEQRINEINNSPEIFPGSKQAALNAENALHQQNLNNLQNQLNANLRSVNC